MNIDKSELPLMFYINEISISSQIYKNKTFLCLDNLPLKRNCLENTVKVWRKHSNSGFNIFR